MAEQDGLGTADVSDEVASVGQARSDKEQPVGVAIHDRQIAAVAECVDVLSRMSYYEAKIATKYLAIRYG